MDVRPDAPRDVPHRNPDGTLAETGIEGVELERPQRHVDHRGSLFEAISHGHHFWREPVVHSEWVVTHPGRIKGWGMHRESTDRYVLGTGRMRVVLYDGRTESASFGRFVQYHFSDESPGWLRIPCGVWHANQNYGATPSIVVNFPTDPHFFENPDKYRLDPHDRSRIDFDWSLRDG